MISTYILALIGGLIIGLAAGGLYLLVGEIAGISGIVRSAMNGPQRNWPIAFIAGILAAGLFAPLFPGTDFTAGIEKLSLATLVLAGLLVGIGTDIGNGCTSGHGVCGLARFSKRSLVAVAIFMTTAGLTLFLVRHGGLL